MSLRVVTRLVPKAAANYALLDCGHERPITTAELRQVKRVLRVRGHWKHGKANGEWIQQKPRLACGECAPRKTETVSL